MMTGGNSTCIEFLEKDKLSYIADLLESYQKRGDIPSTVVIKPPKKPLPRTLRIIARTITGVCLIWFVWVEHVVEDYTMIKTQEELSDNCKKGQGIYAVPFTVPKDKREAFCKCTVAIHAEEVTNAVKKNKFIVALNRASFGLFVLPESVSAELGAFAGKTWEDTHNTNCTALLTK
jgi:hypothetical protein